MKITRISPVMHYKAALIVALTGAAATDSAAGWPALALLLFGAANVLMFESRVLWTRGIAFLACLAALLEPPSVERVAIIAVPLLWLAFYAVESNLARQVRGPNASNLVRANWDARLSTAAVILAAAIGAAYYQWTVSAGLQQTAALFIGVPALLAIVVVFAVTPRTATGVACKAVTVGLLISLLFLGEGVLCVLMSAPLFYLVAVAIGTSIDRARDRANNELSVRAAAPVVVIIAMSLEGVHSATSLNRDESVTVTRVVAAPADIVARALFERPRFERVLPRLLQAGFPRPISTWQTHTGLGSQLIIAFRGGEMRLDGLEPRTGDLTLECVESKPGLARWDAKGDDSHMTHYLAWRGATVRWTAVSAIETRVEWTLHYRRSLDPAWYFGPMERFAVRLAASYLIDSVATP
jgi:hypothetical protein